MCKKITWFLLYLFIHVHLSYSQSAGEKRMAEDLLFFIMNVEWPQKVLNKEVFSVGVLDKDEVFSRYMRNILNNTRINDLPVSIYHFANTENVFPCHVLIISKSRNRKIDKVFENVKKDNILLITEKGKDESYLMIDYSDASTGEFQIYTEHIEKAGLKISDELKAYALGDITLQELYYQSRNQLSDEKQIVKNQLNDIRDRKDELDRLIKEINQKNLIVRDKQMEIDIQTERLKSLSDRLRTQQIVILLSSLAVLFLSLTLFLLYKNFALKMETNIKLKAKNDAINEQKQQIEQKNLQITDSINYAKRIQGAILIPESELVKALGDVFVYFIPRDIVSGDFYWFSEVQNGYILVSVDCTGHGVPGAFMSMIGNTLLNQIVKADGCTNPAEILKHLHEDISKSLNHKGNDNDVQDGMDAAVLFVSQDKKKVIFSGAIQSIYVVKNNELETIPGGKISIGDHFLTDIANDKSETLFTNHEFNGKNTSIYMFSDGYIDQFGGPENKKYNISNFKQFILDLQDKPMRKQKELFDLEFQKWKGSHLQTDDVTILGLKLE
jgi:serine phosphatase RsbU (regulator of sigma subunit)